MGSNNSKDKTNSTTTGTTTTTPNVPQWALDPVQGYASGVNDFIHGDWQTPNLGPSTQQGQAWNMAQGIAGGGGSQNINGAMDSIRGLLGNVQAHGYNANGYNANGYNANGYNASGVDVGQLKNTDLSAYMNPFTDAVEKNALNAVERSREGAITQNQAAATQAKAFGGSRHAWVDNGTNDEAMRASGDLSAQLRAANFGQAQQAAMGDIGLNFARDQFNSNAMNTMGQFNAGAMNQAGQFNANAMNQSGQFNADAMNTAGQFNANAMKGADDYRLNAANSLGALGLSSNADTRANAGLLSQFGADQRNIDMQNNPYTRQLLNLAAQQGLLSGIPLDQISGQTTTGNTQTQGTTTHSNSGLDWLNGIAQFFNQNASGGGGG